MHILLPQFFFRLVFGLALAIFVMPSRLADRSSVRLILWGLTFIAALAATVLYARAGEVESGGKVWVMPVCVSAAALAGSLLWRRERSDLAGAAVGTLSLLGLIFALLTTPWSPDTTAVGLLLGIIDLASCGLILGATMSAVLLSLWHLNTPNMQAATLRIPVVLMVSAAAARTALCLFGSGVVMAGAESQAALFWLFLASRWIMALLGLAFLVLFRRELGKPPQSQRGVGLLFGGLCIVTIGELGSQLVSVDLFYPI
jgi:hypothetical protein